MGRSQNCAPYMGSGRGWLAGNWSSTGCVLDITAAAWTAGFQWWRSGDIRRTQNVSEYMLVLAVCLVWFIGCLPNITWIINGTKLLDKRLVFYRTLQPNDKLLLASK